MDEELARPLVITGYSPNRCGISQAVPEVVNHIRKWDRFIPQEIINKAVDNYYELNQLYHATKNNVYDISPKTKSVKGTRQQKLIFYCIFKAYDDLGQTVDPYYIANLIDMNPLDTTQAFTECCPNGNFWIDPKKFVKFYLIRIQEILDDMGKCIKIDQEKIYKEVEEIINQCHSTQYGDNTLNNTPSGKIAIVAIYFYLTKFSNIPALNDISIFEEAGYLSGACIRSYLEIIEKCYNSRDEIMPNKQISVYW